MNSAANIEGKDNLLEFKKKQNSSSTWYQRWGKRGLDLCFSAPALILLSPVFLISALAVRLDSSGPIFFRQRRIGRYGRPFYVLKFRTMIHDPERKGPTVTASSDTRITRVGRFLRKSKLDELPQLLNVVSGQMTLVGPRPEVAEYVALYTQEQSAVLQLKPGITGAASLSFSNEEAELAAQNSPEEYYVRVLMPRKLMLDLEYSAKVSLKEDIRLIALTVTKIVRHAFKSTPGVTARESAL
ncbi:MAG: sugar transferase [Acidobacteriaceae bacterium]|nr:sugar transferase [Acidobacteriaceae bacterium]